MTQSLLLRPHEFSQDVGVVSVKPNQSLRAMLQEACGDGELDESLDVRVGGYVVPAAFWARLRPKEGAVIHVTRRGLSGGSARQWIGIAIMLVVSWYAPQIGAWAAGAFGVGAAAFWAGAAVMLASLAVSALTKPPTAGATSGTDGQWNQLTGTQNSINPWGAIPFVIGESRFFPPHAALPYSQSIGESSYQYCLFDLGYGDIEVSDIRIGETPLSQYDEVQYEVTKTPTLYTTDVAELSVAASMEDDDVVTRTTSAGITRIALDIVYPQGLFGVGTSGKDFVMWVKWRIEYRAVGESAWLTPGGAGLALSGFAKEGAIFESKFEKKKPFAVGASWDVPAGQYEVRVTRVDSLRGNPKNTYVDAATWTVLRSIKAGQPSTTGTNKLAMRIKATDQLSGSLQTLSLIVRQKIKVYDRVSGTWSAPQVNLNPAWVAWWLMTECEGFSKHVPVNRMNLESFADYAEFCAEKSLEARSVQDSATTAGELVEGVLNCSLGSLGRRDGRYSIVFDSGDTTPTMMFTPLESNNVTVSRSFVRIPQALRVQFKNPDANWAEDEIIVLDDGYSYRGVDARGNPSDLPEPTEFETMRVQYAADAIHCWRLARYQFAQAKFRPEVFSFQSDIAGLGTTRGDVVGLSHDVTEWGVGWGRVVDILDGGISGAAATVVLDQLIDTNADESYSLQIRRQDGNTEVFRIVASGGQASHFAIDDVPSNFRAGDVAAVGLTEHVSEKLLVTGVRYQNGGGETQFTAVAYDDRVAPYCANPPASIPSEISGVLFSSVPKPIVTGVTGDVSASNSDDAGILTPVIRIGVNEPSQQHTELLEQLR